MNHTYRCIGLLNITNYLILKTNDHVNNTMLLWGELHLLFISSDHLYEVHIVYQMENYVNRLADKSEDHIERGH